MHFKHLFALTLVNIPLTKASYMARPKSRCRKVHFKHHEVVAEYGYLALLPRGIDRTNNSNYHKYLR